ncbi:MAG: sulfide-dependent adenosine diphosphate thiazole synthase [Candidatus Altiarchaeota archaeon]|nr:sulfide-dependent adenosine diphosphate thiazole synthase [Candidatus Altiarchaeota archaeon]
MISETEITRAILEDSLKDLLDSLMLDVAIVGGGPSGLVAARYLAEGDAKVALFERKLSVGGGMWGGGMLFPRIVVEEDAVSLLEEFEITYKKDGDYFIANSIESVVKSTAKAIDSGAKIFNSICVEDVVIREDRISGVVLNWTPVEMAGLHVDPLAFSSRFVVDATGHAAEICQVTQKKVGKLNTPSGQIEGERSMWADKSEALVIENTKEVYPGLFVTGMAANAVFGAPRMGPIFGGMLLSGKKAAELILEKL